ncbi:hypothetical protein F4778DRAFT_673643 [Xylariomycetidae sp. FL2044]|nr:hypothetical protein F4778DRAFT_673643 [Xylariomycetidae sp. FL2044]
MTTNVPESSQKRNAYKTSGLRCPYSKCCAQLFQFEEKGPCTDTKFDMSHLVEHIWRYHSHKQSCEHCDHRFRDAPQTDHQKLQRMKSDHNAKEHSQDGQQGKKGKEEKGGRGRQKREKGKEEKEKPKAKDPLLTMTPEGDARLKAWQRGKGRDRSSEKKEYISLCKCLFGDNIELPDDYKSPYWIPEHTSNPSNAELGQRNIDNITKERRTLSCSFPSSQGLTASFSEGVGNNLPPHTDPYSLDDDNAARRTQQWDVSKGVDSGYVTKSAQEDDEAKSHPKDKDDYELIDPTLRPSNHAQDSLLGLCSPKHGTAPVFDRTSYPGGDTMELDEGDSMDWGSESSDGRKRAE